MMILYIYSPWPYYNQLSLYSLHLPHTYSGKCYPRSLHEAVSEAAQAGQADEEGPRGSQLEVKVVHPHDKRPTLLRDTRKPHPQGMDAWMQETSLVLRGNVYVNFDGHTCTPPNGARIACKFHHCECKKTHIHTCTQGYKQWWGQMQICFPCSLKVVTKRLWASARVSVDLSCIRSCCNVLYMSWSGTWQSWPVTAWMWWFFYKQTHNLKVL